MKRPYPILLVLLTLLCSTLAGQIRNGYLEITTADKLYRNGKRHYMSVSPLAAFDGYLDLYPQVPNPLGYHESWDVTYGDRMAREKNYSVTWKIADGKLYLSDLYFFTLDIPEYDYKDYFKPDENARFTAIEKLTGKKFDRSSHVARIKPQSPYGVIPATWFSDTLYIMEQLDPFDIASPDNSGKPQVFRLVFSSGCLINTKKLNDVH